jgi:hypothetical protein
MGEGKKGGGLERAEGDSYTAVAAQVLQPNLLLVRTYST